MGTSQRQCSHHLHFSPTVRMPMLLCPWLRKARSVSPSDVARSYQRSQPVEGQAQGTQSAFSRSFCRLSNESVSDRVNKSLHQDLKLFRIVTRSTPKASRSCFDVDSLGSRNAPTTTTNRERLRSPFRSGHSDQDQGRGENLACWKMLGVV